MGSSQFSRKAHSCRGLCRVHRCSGWLWRRSHFLHYLAWYWYVFQVLCCLSSSPCEQSLHACTHMNANKWIMEKGALYDWSTFSSLHECVCFALWYRYLVKPFLRWDEAENSIFPFFELPVFSYNRALTWWHLRLLMSCMLKSIVTIIERSQVTERGGMNKSNLRKVCLPF